MSERIPAFVLGGSGYVAGELLRLLAQHPHFALGAALSDSRPGEPLAAAFPHLASSYPEQCFSSQAQLQQQLCATPRAALFSAAPHGVSAQLIDTLLGAAERSHTAVHAVDISADFRYASADAYAAVYPHAHGAPRRLPEFTCALPEHLARAPTAHVAHPGCFASAILLACVPLLAGRLSGGPLFVSGVTGSTGSGSKPVPGTHHPQRHSDLYSYGALSHRHAPEVIACARAATGIEAQLAFVPHSGPFARGIHVTVQASLARACSSDELLELLRAFYARAPFVRVRSEAPRLKEVVASNYAQLSGAVRGNTLAVLCALDNLTKGAAGGAVQWMNRLFDLPETAGLTAPAPGWT